MLALAYDAALRREELCLLETDDLDPAHRTLTVRAETTKTRRGRVVPYSAVAGELLARLSAAPAHDHGCAGGVVRVGVAAQPGAADHAVDVVEGRPLDRGTRGRSERFSTHTLRHLCLTDLARSGWELHQIATFAGHQRDGHDPSLHPPVRPRSRRPAGERDDADPRAADRADRRGARMTALAGERSQDAPQPVWVLALSASHYDRRPGLSEAERAAVGELAGQRTRWPAELSAVVARLTDPIDDVLRIVTPQAAWWGRGPARRALVAAMSAEASAFWGWDRDRWLRVLAGGDAQIRQLMLAVAYLVCGQRDLHLDLRGFKARKFAGRVFDQARVDAAIGRVQAHMDGLGHPTVLGRPMLTHALMDVMLLAGSPLLEDLGARADLFVALRSRELNNARRHGVEQLARTLVEMGVLSELPFRTQPSREEWLAAESGRRDRRARGVARLDATVV